MSSPANLSDTKRKLLEALLRGEVKGPGRPLAIPQRDSSGPAPLSPAQEQVWLHSHLAPAVPIYNESLTVHHKGSLDVGVLERSLTEITRRHEAWRTAVSLAHDEPHQIVHPPLDVRLPLRDLRDIPESEREREARRLAALDARQPFDMARGPLWRGTLVRTGKEEHRLYLTIHQIILDGVSANRVFLPELVSLYNAFSRGHASPLPELPIQYADYATWQRRQVRAGAFHEDVPYWRSRLGGEPAVLEWPNDHARPSVQTFRGAIQHLAMAKGLVQGLKAMSRREGVTLFMTLVAGLVALLHRYTGQDDLTVGTLSAGRRQPDTEGLLGYFLNPVALRLDLSGNPTFRELLGRVREAVIGAMAHDGLPFHELVKELRPRPDPSRNPLFQVLISLEPRVPPVDPAWDLTFFDVTSGASKLDLYLLLDEGPAGITAPTTYNPDVFEESTITRMADHWRTLLEGALGDATRRVSHLPILTKGERRRLLLEWNQTGREYAHGCVHELIEAQVERAPERVAVSFADSVLTYGELNARANQLGRRLRELGVGAETLVGVCMERSLGMLVGLLGIWKAGGAHVPLDIHHPEERLRWMVRDSALRVIVTEVAQRERVATFGVETVGLGREGEGPGGYTRGNLERSTRAENLAYVIYTSGSTGVPKGVEITHRNLVNFLASMEREPGLGAQDVLAAVTTISFDIAALELYLPLVVGGRVELVCRDDARDGYRLKERLRTSGATCMQATPSTWRMLVEAGWEGGKAFKALCGGEAMPQELGRELVKRAGTVWNMYGPTETTVWSSVYRLRDRDEVILTGRPIANTQLYVLDGQMQPLPPGAKGELCIGGDGVARGYRNLPESTAERFLGNPFQMGRIYRTGDVARYRQDGNVECLGRVDQQVKLRGHRIELAEIEAVLGKHPGVRETAVTVWERAPGDARLVAYVTAGAAGKPTSRALRRHLQERLPAPMVPAAFVSLEALPLTPSGKLDRRALPPPEGEAGTEACAWARPRDALELRIAQVWEEVLGTGPVGIHDDFFDLGGHSLLAARMVARLERAFGKSLPPAVLFQAPTVEQLGGMIRDGGLPPLGSPLAIQPRGSKPPLFGLPGPDAYAPTSSLVTVHPQGAGRPFFCVHGYRSYPHLSRYLGPDQPLCGLAQHLTGRRIRHRRIEDIARHYLDEVHRVEPKGPYFLGGHSFGAVVAFEMAHQIRTQGREVTLLILIDPPRLVGASWASPAGGEQAPPVGGPTPRGAALRARLARQWSGLRALSARDRLAVVRDALRRREVKRFLKTVACQVFNGLAISLPSELRAFYVEEIVYGSIYRRAQAAYAPPAYSGRVIMYKAQQGLHDADRGWGALVDTLEVHEIAGDHLSILVEPDVAGWAKPLAIRLRGAQASMLPAR